MTDAVHREGGVIFAQLMHTGRIGHPSLLPDGLTPVGPSAVAAKGQVFTHEGLKDFVTPKELNEAEIRQTIADFATAAQNAIEAGFDRVEIHGANGYLILMIRRFLSVVVRHCDVSAVGIELSPAQPVVGGVLSGDTDADLVLTFLAMFRVGLLPIGTAWCVLPLVRALVPASGCDLSVS